MIRRYCDVCEVEIKESVTSQRLTHMASKLPYAAFETGVRLDRESYGRDVAFEVVAGVNGTMNGGDLCRHCLLDAIASCDDRPRGEGQQ